MGLGGFCPLPIRLGGSPIKGLTARQHARLCATMVALVRSSKLAVVTIDRSGPTVGSIVAYNGQNGIGLAHAPVLTLAGAGEFDLTFPHRWEDKYGHSYPVHIRHARATPIYAIARMATCTITAPNVVHVRVCRENNAVSSVPATVTVY